MLNISLKLRIPHAIIQILIIVGNLCLTDEEVDDFGDKDYEYEDSNSDKSEIDQESASFLDLKQYKIDRESEMLLEKSIKSKIFSIF